jgi:hypothetical protein
MKLLVHVRCVYVDRVDLASMQLRAGKRGTFDVNVSPPVKYRFEIDDEWPLDFWRSREGRVVLLSAEFIDAEQQAAEPDLGDLRIDAVTDIPLG